MTTKRTQQQSWLRALADAAKEQNVALPPFTGHAMGTARCESATGGRFVTFKRRLVPKQQAGIDGVEWTLWIDEDSLPTPVAAFREAEEPSQESAKTLTLLKGWLVDGWTPGEARAAVGTHPSWTG